MKLLQQLQKLNELGLSTADKQHQINVSEVFHLWNHLVQRYYVISVTNILETYAKDNEFKIILGVGRNSINEHINILEKEMMSYGIPLPIRHPKQTNITSNLEQISDRYIFRRILRGIQLFLPTHTMAFVHSTSPKIRELFMFFLVEEMKIYDRMVEYGKLKGYTVNPPTYKPS